MCVTRPLHKVRAKLKIGQIEIEGLIKTWCHEYFFVFFSISVQRRLLQSDDDKAKEMYC